MADVRESRPGPLQTIPGAKRPELTLLASGAGTPRIQSSRAGNRRLSIRQRAAEAVLEGLVHTEERERG